MCKLNPNNENKGSPGSPAGTESTCNAGDPGSIPGLIRSPGEGRGYSPQYSDSASNPPAEFTEPFFRQRDVICFLCGFTGLTPLFQRRF